MAQVVASPPEAGHPIGSFLAEHERVAGELARRQPAWVRDLRAQALARFAELGIPTTRDEEWRFTNVSPIAETAFRLAEPAEDAARSLVGRVATPESHRLVVVNGRYAETLSSVEPDAGLVCGSLAEALADAGGGIQAAFGRIATFEDRAFAALNTAFARDGVFLRVRRGAVVERPVHVIYVTVPGAEPAMAHPRLLALVGANAQARIIESFVGVDAAKYLVSAVSEFDVGEDAVVDHYKDQREGSAGFHIGLQATRCGRSAAFVSHAFTLGGEIVRNDVVAVLDGEGVDCTLNGLYLSDGKRLVDNHTLIDHARPHCGSHELYKGILAGESRAVFNGKIIVRPDAQKTDAKQTNRALLLSDTAQINTKPQLEIFADDVKCTHGAAVGQLDEEALFYLVARGLTPQKARDMLIHAFAGDILNRVRIDALREQFEVELFAQLQRDGVM